MATKTVSETQHRYVHDTDVPEYEHEGWSVCKKHPKGEPTKRRNSTLMERIVKKEVEVPAEPKKKEEEKKEEPK